MANRTGLIFLTPAEIQRLIDALNSNNGAQQHIAVTFLKTLLEGEEV